MKYLIAAALFAAGAAQAATYHFEMRLDCGGMPACISDSNSGLVEVAGSVPTLGTWTASGSELLRLAFFTNGNPDGWPNLSSVNVLGVPAPFAPSVTFLDGALVGIEYRLRTMGGEIPSWRDEWFRVSGMRASLEGNGYSQEWSLAVVSHAPEPGTVAMLLLGLPLLLTARGR